MILNISDTAIGIGQQLTSTLQERSASWKLNMGDFIWDVIAIIFIFVIAKVVMHLISACTKFIMNHKKIHSTPMQAQRTDTLMTLFRSAARYFIYFIAVLMVLNQLNLGKPMENMLLTAGIGSLAIGFGAQNLVRDVVTGFFMMFENQFSVGDFIKTDEAEGTVEATAVRVTYLRSFKGDQIIIPNGSISRVINYSRGNSVAVVVVNISYEANTRDVLGVLEQAVTHYAEEHADLVTEPPVVQGITSFGTSSIEIRAVCKVQPMKHWEVERGMRLAIKELFDAEGIAFPYPHIVTVPHPPAKSIQIAHRSSLYQEPKDSPNWVNVKDDDD